MFGEWRLKRALEQMLRGEEEEWLACVLRPSLVPSERTTETPIFSLWKASPTAAALAMVKNAMGAFEFRAEQGRQDFPQVA